MLEAPSGQVVWQQVCPPPLCLLNQTWPGTIAASLPRSLPQRRPSEQRCPRMSPTPGSGGCARRGLCTAVRCGPPQEGLAHKRGMCPFWSLTFQLPLTTPVLCSLRGWRAAGKGTLRLEKGDKSRDCVGGGMKPRDGRRCLPARPPAPKRALSNRLAASAS